MSNVMINRINHPPGDFYETPAFVTNTLLEYEEFIDVLDKNDWILDPCCGNGAIIKALSRKGFDAEGFDIKRRNYEARKIDFLSLVTDGYDMLTPDGFVVLACPDYIITNPPFKLALPFVRQALKFARKKVAMLLRMQFYETKGRHEFLRENPPIRIYSFSDRVDMIGSKSGMMWFAWFVWEIGYKGPTTIIPILSKG